MIFVIWMIGVFFTDGLKDPHNQGGVKEFFKILFNWPWQLGRYVRARLDET